MKRGISNEGMKRIAKIIKAQDDTYDATNDAYNKIVNNLDLLGEALDIINDHISFDEEADLDELTGDFSEDTYFDVEEAGITLEEEFGDIFSFGVLDNNKVDREYLAASLYDDWISGEIGGDRKPDLM